MKLRQVVQWRSLQTRVTLTTLIIFVLGLWSLAFYATRMLRTDMERLLGEQQFSAASYIAADINQQLEERLEALGRLAATVTPALLADPAALQSLLEHRLGLPVRFNGGVAAMGPDGTVIADVPLSAGRIGVNYLDVDAASAVALKKGRATIGKPVMGKKLGAPVFVMVVPVRDAQGKVVGAVAGVTNLGAPNFLDKMTEGRNGKDGVYLLVAPQYRLVVTASDKRRIMEVLPAAGVNAMIDRFIGGYEGSGVLVNPQGVEVLSSAKGIAAAGWYVVASLSTAEAFAPIRVVESRMLLAAIVLTLLAAVVSWWLLRRQLMPLTSAAETLAGRMETNQLLQPLTVALDDEIGQLVGGFNRLLEVIGQREAALKESEARYRTAFLTSPDAVNINRVADGRYLECNEGFLRLTGWSRDQVIGRTSREINIWQNLADRQRLVDALERDGYCENLEANFLARDGRVITGLMSSRLMSVKGEACILSVTRDVTGRKSDEEQIRKLSLAVEQSAESIVITDIDAKIEYVNEAFVQNTGYSREEAIGQNPSILNSGKTPRESYAALWQALSRGLAWSGEFYNRRKDGSDYLESAVITPIRQPDGLITHFVAVKQDITAKRAAEEEIRRLAFYDPLTRLANRRLLLDRLQQALASSTRNGRYGALLFIDLDDFKTLNDTLGHDIGDLLLQQVAERLATCVREGDTVARLGGDEFVVMLEYLSESATEAAAYAEAVGEKIILTLNREYPLAGYLQRSTPSIGVTLFVDHQGSMEDLLKRADLAMYQAKAAGRNTLRFFEPEMQAAVTARAVLEAGLREALQQGQLILHYQAQVDGASRITGVEALVRWQHPGRGLVMPAEFIPLAEETGLILPLGHWVLETACAQLAAWAGREEMAELTIAVNVSARQFHHRDFVDQVLAILEDSGADPQRLKLELTESLLVDDFEAVIGRMSALKERGVGFSLDDFGTGYSSLSYLKRLPLDQLKIDRGFVRDILVDGNDAAIARMVIALAGSMGLAIIAEGVETEAQRDFLAREGCHDYQGYLFSRPLPLAEFETYATSTRRNRENPAPV